MHYTKQHPFKLLCIPCFRSIQQVVERFPFPIAVTRGDYENIIYIFQDNSLRILHDEQDIRNFDFTWTNSGWNTRDLAYGLHLYLKNEHLPHSRAEQSASKITDTVVFCTHNIPIPNTVFVSCSQLMRNIGHIENVCGYPLIIKDIKGSQGKHSHLIQNREELQNILPKLPKNKRFLCQQFIPNEYDWGVIVANGRVVSGEKSYPKKGEFRNHASRGAKERFVDVRDIPETIRDIAIRANNLLGLSWSRADIIIDERTDKPYLLEVNRYPGITRDSCEVAGAYAFLASHITPSEE
jgi:hypothetical protein